MLRKFSINSSAFMQLFYKNNKFIHTQISPTASLSQPATVDETQQLQQVHIDEAVSVNPLLARVPISQWQLIHKTFKNHGLDTTNFLRIVTGNPAVLSRQPERSIDAIELWRSCQFGEKFMFQLLTKYPELFNIEDGRRLRKQIGYLKTFAGTDKNIWKILITCPDVLEQSEYQIEEKVQYLKNRMRVETPEIVKSEALSKPLDEIRCRHIFLERLGLFKPRPLKVDPDEPSKNPRLYQITNTSEKAFATKVCYVTLAEFEAFKELYERELQRKDDEDEEEDEEIEKPRGYKTVRGK